MENERPQIREKTPPIEIQRTKLTTPKEHQHVTLEIPIETETTSPENIEHA